MEEINKIDKQTGSELCQAQFKLWPANMLETQPASGFLNLHIANIYSLHNRHVQKQTMEKDVPTLETHIIVD